jgi:hypothetical protein
MVASNSSTWSMSPLECGDQWQSFGQLHGWSRGVVSFHLPFGFPFRQGALALGRFIAWPSFGCLSLFRFCCGAGKKVVWSGMSGCGGQLRYNSVCPYRGFSVSSCRTTELIPKVVEHLPVSEGFVQKITPGCRELRSRPAALT